MAYVPQAKNVASAYTALEMVLLGRSSHLNIFESPKVSDVKKAMEVLGFLGISHLAEKKCSVMKQNPYFTNGAVYPKTKKDSMWQTKVHTEAALPTKQ